jgi:hypothetical protein
MTTSPTWVRVVAFSDDPEDRVAHLSFRLTKKGRVNMTDVRKYLGKGLFFDGSSFKIPLRYTSYGIRKLNPDVGWPYNKLYVGDPPEEMSVLARLTGWSERMRAEIIAQHPSKFTPEEYAWITSAEGRLLAGAASPETIEKRAALLKDLESRPFTGDEW